MGFLLVPKLVTLNDLERRSGHFCVIFTEFGNIKSVLRQKSFYRSANAIFGKVGKVANEDVVVQLLSSKCMPSLMYGLETCPLMKSDLSSLDFVINRFFMKLFKACNIDVAKICQQYFNYEMPSTLWSKRCASFNNKCSSSENVFCKITQCSI